MRAPIVFSLAAVSTLVACVQSAQEPTPTTDEDKALYGIGVLLSQQITEFEFTDKELAMLKAGVADGAKGTEKISLEDIQTNYMGKIQEMHSARATAAVDRRKSEGAEYLAKAAAESGAVKSESGIVYRITSEGTGASPTAQDTVRVNYEGRFIDGKVFDKTEGTPVEFPVTGVIPCWTEGVQKMKVGGKAVLVCPPDQAYGDAGRGPTMPGGSTLVFDVELVDVIKGPAQ